MELTTNEFLTVDFLKSRRSLRIHEVGVHADGSNYTIEHIGNPWELACVQLHRRKNTPFTKVSLAAFLKANLSNIHDVQYIEIKKAVYTTPIDNQLIVTTISEQLVKSPQALRTYQAHARNAQKQEAKKSILRIKFSSKDRRKIALMIMQNRARGEQTYSLQEIEKRNILIFKRSRQVLK